MVAYLVALLGASIVFLSLNTLWIGVIAQRFYQREMGVMMASSFNIAAAGAFYVIYLGGLLFFAIGPALVAESPAVAAFRGGLFGLICYATYDLTNLAVMRHYPARLALVDITAGTSVTALAASGGFLATTLL